jgi:selenide,water dikinase
MARSRLIGHCVCDPRKSCPCPLLAEKNVCTCAGEREPTGTREQVRLTRYTRSAGCASKIGQQDLHDVLATLPPVQDPRILVGMGTGDDAGVLRLNDATTIVQTVDVFTPTVDDPVLFGRIAACNSLSDVYAMGGRPVTALSIVGFPADRLPLEVMGDMLRGGMEALEEAGVLLLGGHSLNDEEVKLGFAVTGVVDPSRVITNAGAQPGDLLVLTKPLGTGILSLALQVGRADPEDARAAEVSMAASNRLASEIMSRRGATAATDVTGFGLLGHLAQLAIESGVTAELWLDSLPLLPGALGYARRGYYSGAVERNAEFSARRTELDPGIEEPQRAVLFDPQTSGGLLIAFPVEAAAQALEELHRAGVSEAALVGRILERSDGRIRVRGGGASPARAPGDRLSTTAPAAGQASGEAACCAEHTKETNMADKTDASCCGSGEGSSGSSMGQFADFLGAALRPGAVDVVTKELIAIALGLAVHCVPCAKAHIKKARGMGISPEEIEEAASLAVAFSGCRALMLWNELKGELLKG